MSKHALRSPNWNLYKRVWWIVSIILFILILLMFLFGYAAGGKRCQANNSAVPLPVDSRTGADQTAPVINADALATQYIKHGSSYTLPTLSAMDDRDGEISVTTMGTVNTQFPGEYELIHSAIDKAGNMTTETQQIIVGLVNDQTGPVISIDSAPLKFLTLDDDFSLPEATAYDLVDGNVEVNLLGSVDTSTPGSYKITYTARDLAGNISQVHHIIIVKEPALDTAPLISLNGPGSLNLNVGDEFIDSGATAMDGNGQDLTIHSDGVVDTSKAGKYKLTYTATDVDGNSSSLQREIIVSAISDTNPPVINLNQAPLQYIDLGEEYTLVDASAFDHIDGELEVSLDGKVDTQTEGHYVLSYTAVDKAGNKATATQTVVVAAPKLKPDNEATTDEKTDVKTDGKQLPTARLYFDKNVATDPKDTKKTFDKLMKYLHAHKDSIAVVSGFHDPSGDKELNRALAKKRAETVIGLLKKAGIPAKRIRENKPSETTGSGSPTEARRVEIKIGSKSSSKK